MDFCLSIYTGRRKVGDFCMVLEGTVGQVVIGVWSYKQTYGSEHPKGLYSVSDRGKSHRCHVEQDIPIYMKFRNRQNESMMESEWRLPWIEGFDLEGSKGRLLK